MADIEKVIKGLELCFHGQECCGDIECPYYIEHLSDCCCLEKCQENLKADALALLKEQEAIEPIPFFTTTGEESKNYVVCGHCKSINSIMPKDTKQKYCHECGRLVLWEGR